MFSATARNASFRSSPRARRGPPSGECAITATPASVQRSSTPPRSSSVVEGAERDLHRGDRRELERLVQLVAVDVADADPRDEPLVDELRESADGRAPRRPRVGRVEEVEVDREPVERGEARLAVGADRPRAAVGHPGAAGPRHPALRHDPRGLGGIARAQGMSEEPLAVPELVLSPPVRPRRVEHGDPRCHRRRDRLEGALLVRSSSVERRMQPSPTRSSVGASRQTLSTLFRDTDVYFPA